ncbi:hypothetical protein SAMN05216226_1299 [Halovenus aranensis]|uniref:Uncharacterized protein n=1 Tax=Halovenus aranensis TaxID=890420 RepID=A0A1G8ZQY7_9EURY|nr:hypothetical protein [Halovenus aranensis]SDK16580.1 hypothetical protein SAMN05216226_1299 [Halovenus aranensis]
MEDINGTFLLLNGDNTIGANLQDVIATYRETDADGVALVTEVTPEEARRTGAVAIEDRRVVESMTSVNVPPTSAPSHTAASSSVRTASAAAALYLQPIFVGTDLLSLCSRFNAVKPRNFHQY